LIKNVIFEQELRDYNILKMIEKQNIEWKESWRSEYFQWICAFANTEGGKLLIGVNDEGAVVGVDDYEGLLVKLPNQIRDLLGVICKVNHHQEENKHYIEIVINAYSVPISYKGKYYTRSGSTTQLLTGNSLNDFLLRKVGQNWDEVIEPNATLNDIDESAIVYFKHSANHGGRLKFTDKDTDHLNVLKNLRLVDNNGGIKRAALLLFGKDPLNFFTSAQIKIGKFGDSGSELLSQDVVEGNIFEQADKVMDILDKKYFQKSISYDGNNRIETTQYPYLAIREVLLNAIVHRVYNQTPAITIRIFNDKLEIWNIGELPQQLSPEDLKTMHNSYPKNPLLAQVFYKGGLIESWGRGTIKVLEECKNAELPEPAIIEQGGGVLVTLFKNRVDSEYLFSLGLNKRQVFAVYHVKENGYITNSIYQEICKTSERTASRDLKTLTELKILKKIGSNKGTKYELF